MNSPGSQGQVQIYKQCPLPCIFGSYFLSNFVFLYHVPVTPSDSWTRDFQFLRFALVPPLTDPPICFSLSSSSIISTFINSLHQTYFLQAAFSGENIISYLKQYILRNRVFPKVDLRLPTRTYILYAHISMNRCSFLSRDEKVWRGERLSWLLKFSSPPLVLLSWS